MSGLIERQAAIDAVRELTKWYYETFHEKRPTADAVIDKLMMLPSAQPEIIRCKDCKWYELPSHKIYENCVRWMKSNGILLPIKPDDYCGYAERRTDD